MNCSSCAKPLKEDSKFCPACGTPTGEEESVPSHQEFRIQVIEKALGNKYKIIRKLGSGGFADVYLGEQTQLGRNVAIKILRVTEAEQNIERFRRESRAAAKLSHPNIIDIYDVGDSGDIYYFVMKHIPGDTLGTMMKREGRMEPTAAIQIIKQLADALAYAHDRGIIHRDIKPANVLMDEFGKPILMDFGIARLELGGQLTRTGTLMGTPHYLPPEQPMGNPVDGRSDIYSLGIMFYEMLAGRVPFEDDAAIALIYKHINSPPPPLSEISPDLRPELVQIVHKTIEKSPDDRYQSAFDLYDALDELSVYYPFRSTPSSARRSTPSALHDTEKLSLLAKEHLHQEKYLHALEIYSTLLIRYPNHSEFLPKRDEVLELLIQKIEKNISAREFDVPRTEITKLSQLFPEDPRLNDLRRSLEKEEQTFQKDSEIQTHLQAARLAIQHDNATGAVEYLTKALTIDPKNPEANLLLKEARATYESNRKQAELANVMAEAEYHFNEGSFEQARKAVENALRIERNPEVLQLQERVEQALKQKEFRDLEKKRLVAKIDQLCESLQFDDVDDLLESNRDIIPDLVQVMKPKIDRSRKLNDMLNLASKLRSEERLEESANAYDEFLNFPTPYDFQVFYQKRKEAEDSRREIQKEIQEFELREELKRADVLERMQRWEHAREAYRSLLAKRPDHPVALRKLKEIEKKLNPPEPPKESHSSKPEIEAFTVTEPLPHQNSEPPSSGTEVISRRTVAPPPIPRAAPPERVVVAKRPSIFTPIRIAIVGGVFLIFVMFLVFRWAPDGNQDQSAQSTKESSLQPAVKRELDTPPPAGSPAKTVSVSIDVQPWASIEITGSNLKNPITDTTPLRVLLEPGIYKVTARNPEFSPLSETIEVVEGRTRFQFQFEKLDPEKIADTLIP